MSYVDRLGFTSIIIARSHTSHAHLFLARSFLGATADMHDGSESDGENSTGPISDVACSNNNRETSEHLVVLESIMRRTAQHQQNRRV